MRVSAGFIIGFDGEAPGAGRRIVDFIEDAAIPTTMFSMLQALPNTAMHDRLEREGRLRPALAGVNQTTLMNFVPTRPLAEIAREYVDAFRAVYDPITYLDRVYRYFLSLGPPRANVALRFPAWIDLRALAIVAWRQGVRRRTRWRFWRYLVGMAVRKPAVLARFVTVCAHNEHFLEYREMVSREIEQQLAEAGIGR